MKNTIAKAAAALVLPCLAATSADAQTMIPSGPPASWYSHGGQGDTWRTVMLVSGIVAVIGLAQGDGTLVILGGAGVLLSLYETSPTRFGFDSLPDGAGLHVGRLSFGLDSVPGVSVAPGLARQQPGAYVQWKIRL